MNSVDPVIMYEVTLLSGRKLVSSKVSLRDIVADLHSNSRSLTVDNLYSYYNSYLNRVVSGNDYKCFEMICDEQTVFIPTSQIESISYRVTNKNLLH